MNTFLFSNINGADLFFSLPLSSVLLFVDSIINSYR
jgi:hypothetical protein